MKKKRHPRAKPSPSRSAGGATLGRRALSRRRWQWAAVGAAAALAFAAVATFAAMALWSRGDDEPAGPPRAAIVDQLAATDRNPAFVLRATRLLQDAGYAVDYYPPEAVTVELYRQLPTRGYNFVLLRSHSARNPQRGAESGATSLALFTNEPYVDYGPLRGEVGKLRLLEARYHAGTQSWFAVGPQFIVGSAKGRFQGTTVVLMGCDGMSNNELAKAFVAKGAATFVSWDNDVSAAHTDAASEQLLGHLLSDRLPARAAVAATMGDAGADPVFGGRLVAYP